ncbi:MAG: InlB B-repeat-containing protein, partial [archaeon]
SSYDLAVDTDGSGSTDPSDGTYNGGEEVTITQSPSSGWEFSHWSGEECDGSTSSTCTVTMDSDKSVTAHFEEEAVDEYSLTMNTDGSGSTDPSGTTTHEDGDEVTITQSPSDGWEFSHWSGEECDGSTSSTCTVTMDSDKSVTANFDEKTYSISCSESPSSGGSTGGDCGSTVTHGDSATITASSASGYDWDTWSGDITSSSESYTFSSVTSDKSVTANFAKEPEFYKSCSSTGSASCSSKSCNYDSECDVNQDCGSECPTVENATRVTDDSDCSSDYTGSCVCDDPFGEGEDYCVPSTTDSPMCEVSGECGYECEEHYEYNSSTGECEFIYPECVPGETKACTECCYDRYCNISAGECVFEELCNDGTQTCKNDGTWGACDATEPDCRNQCIEDSDCPN